mmetsp:Transcript_655/g.1861  ORF Transcript_655/g.1861 Transcript_655/m.1861 type:complete len:189 (+) Transcript_655:306-872(+)
MAIFACSLVRPAGGVSRGGSEVRLPFLLRSFAGCSQKLTEHCTLTFAVTSDCRAPAFSGTFAAAGASAPACPAISLSRCSSGLGRASGESPAADAAWLGFCEAGRVCEAARRASCSVCLAVSARLPGGSAAEDNRPADEAEDLRDMVGDLVAGVVAGDLAGDLSVAGDLVAEADLRTRRGAVDNNPLV